MKMCLLKSYRTILVKLVILNEQTPTQLPQLYSYILQERHICNYNYITCFEQETKVKIQSAHLERLA
jgi:hypothetical protein